MSITAIHGDCLEKMKDLPDKSVDCFICDLPYGCLSVNGKSKVNEEWVEKYGKGRNPSPCSSWDVKLNLEDFWIQVKRLCKNDSTPVLMFCNTKFGVELINSNPDWFRYDLVWNKERGVSFLLTNKMPMKSHEMIYVFSKKGSYYKRIDITGEFKSWKAHDRESATRTVVEGSKRNIAVANDGTKRSPLSVITIKKPNTLGHPTEKPKELYEWLLRRYCPEGGTVLDPTAGSFNSIIVAEELGLNGIGIEKDTEFFNKAVEKFS